jgi:hypothetical protein
MNGQEILLPFQSITCMLARGVEAGTPPEGPTPPEPPPDPGFPEPPRRPEDPQPIVEEPPAIPSEVPNPVGDPPTELPRPFGPGRRNPAVGARGRINHLRPCKDRGNRQIQCKNG